MKLQFIAWPIVQSVKTESSDDEADGWTFTFWKPCFLIRYKGHSKYNFPTNIWRIYRWIIVLGYLEVRRFR